MASDTVWVCLWLTGIMLLLWLIYSRLRLSLTSFMSPSSSSSCSSCHSAIKVEDNLLSPDECKMLLKGDRVVLKELSSKLKKRFVVKSLKQGEVVTGVREMIFLNESFQGGEVKGETQTVYPMIGRLVRGELRHQPVRSGEQFVAVVTA